MKTINVIIVDDHEVVRLGLKNFFLVFDDLNLIGEASCGEELLNHSGLSETHVVLMDIIMPKIDGIELTKKLLKIRPDIKVLSLTSYNDPKLFKNVLKAGSSGILLKDTSANLLAEAIRAVYRGKKYLSNEIKEYLDTEQGKEDCININLTDRELDVIKLLATGINNEEIAKKLFVSRSTVKYHICNIFSKLSVTTRTEAVSMAIKYNII